MRTIAVMTGAAGAGKSSIAMQLHEELGFRRVRFAEKLKAMASAMGLDHDEIEGHLKETPCAKLRMGEVLHCLANFDRALSAIGVSMIGVDEDTPQEVLGGRTAKYAVATLLHVVLSCVAKGDAVGGATPRSLMQMIGTDWGRRMIREDLWIDLWRREVRSLPEDAKIVIDDCRFPNEYDECDKQGNAFFFRIERAAATGTLGAMEQKHESEGHKMPCDFVIENNSTIADAAERVRHLLYVSGW